MTKTPDAEERTFDKHIATMPINKGEPEGLLFGCMEKRLPDVYPIIMINHLGFRPGTFFKKTPAGSVGEIVTDKNGGREYELGNVSLAIENGIHTIVICVHTDCAADGGSKNFPSLNEEILFQWDKAEKARQILIERFLQKNPNLEIKLFLLEIKGDQVIITERLRQKVLAINALVQD